MMNEWLQKALKNFGRVSKTLTKTKKRFPKILKDLHSSELYVSLKQTPVFMELYFGIICVYLLCILRSFSCHFILVLCTFSVSICKCNTHVSIVFPQIVLISFQIGSLYFLCLHLYVYAIRMYLLCFLRLLSDHYLFRLCVHATHVS